MIEGLHSRAQRRWPRLALGVAALALLSGATGWGAAHLAARSIGSPDLAKVKAANIVSTTTAPNAIAPGPGWMVARAFNCTRATITATAATFFTWFRFCYFNGTAFNHTTIEFADCCFCSSIITHFNKSKTTAFTGEFVVNYFSAGYFTIAFEKSS